MNKKALIAEIERINAIAGDAPELNMANFSEEDASLINDALTEVYNALDELIPTMRSYELIPVAPTKEMTLAFVGSSADRHHVISCDSFRKSYQAMLQAYTESK